uniref:Uncharacterized protein n=1 Tax=Rhizophora mucronata TaxID=61149 RepID=A0A2P2JYX8_RHIMU
MKKWFDPWPVFFKREWNRNWPFVVGFAVTGAIISKFTLGFTGTYFNHFPLFLLAYVYGYQRSSVYWIIK